MAAPWIRHEKSKIKAAGDNKDTRSKTQLQTANGSLSTKLDAEEARSKRLSAKLDAAEARSKRLSAKLDAEEARSKRLAKLYDDFAMAEVCCADSEMHRVRWMGTACGSTTHGCCRRVVGGPCSWSLYVPTQADSWIYPIGTVVETYHHDQMDTIAGVVLSTNIHPVDLTLSNIADKKMSTLAKWRYNIAVLAPGLKQQERHPSNGRPWVLEASPTEMYRHESKTECMDVDELTVVPVAGQPQ